MDREDKLDDIDRADIKARFTIICNKCGSNDVMLHLEPGEALSELTWAPGSFSMGCNACKRNDFVATI